MVGGARAESGYHRPPPPACLPALPARPQSSFDERPLKKEDFVHILNNSGEVRESFGWQWSPSELEVLGTCMHFMSVPRGNQLFKKVNREPRSVETILAAAARPEHSVFILGVAC